MLGSSRQSVKPGKRTAAGGHQLAVFRLPVPWDSTGPKGQPLEITTVSQGNQLPCWGQLPERRCVHGSWTNGATVPRFWDLPRRSLPDAGTVDSERAHVSTVSKLPQCHNVDTGSGSGY